MGGVLAEGSAGHRAREEVEENFYAEAFSRNRGLISVEEQERLRGSRVAIAGLGGVGGVHLMTLARLGIGRFSIADPDQFDVVNSNRQYGANASTVGRSKCIVMAEMLRDVNPHVEVRCYPEGVSDGNLNDFLSGADLFVDGIDFFSFDVRRRLFKAARNAGIPAVTAGPIGFTGALLVFLPDSMPFDRYFDVSDNSPLLDKLVAFAVGLTPRPTHLRYMDLSKVDPATGCGPSAGLACNLCAALVAAEAVKLLLGRGKVRAAPAFLQFDAYRHVLRKGRLWFGNRGPVQRLARWGLRRKFAGRLPGVS
jgi:molybdopterin/thiamine biosynthesis adenylyltransferase